MDFILPIIPMRRSILRVGYQGTLNFTIYGHETRDPNRSISFRSETLSQTDASTNVKLVAKSDQNIGYLNQTQSAHQGLEAVLWKDIVNADGTTDTVQVNSSSYQASPAIYEVGIVSPNTQAQRRSRLPSPTTIWRRFRQSSTEARFHEHSSDRSA